MCSHGYDHEVCVGRRVYGLGGHDGASTRGRRSLLPWDEAYYSVRGRGHKCTRYYILQCCPYIGIKQQIASRLHSKFKTNKRAKTLLYIYSCTRIEAWSAKSLTWTMNRFNRHGTVQQQRQDNS